MNLIGSLECLNYGPLRMSAGQDKVESQKLHCI